MKLFSILLSRRDLTPSCNSQSLHKRAVEITASSHHINSRYAFVMQDEKAKIPALLKAFLLLPQLCQHNTLHSFGDLYYKINQGKESFKQGRLFSIASAEWSAEPTSSRKRDNTFISEWTPEQVPYCQISDMPLYFLMWHFCNKEIKITPALHHFPV